MKNTLGIREYICIAFFMVGVKATEDTPAILFDQVQNSYWMVPIIAGVIFAIPFFLLIKTMALFEKKHLFEVIRKLMGKYIGFFVCLVIFILTSIAISYDSRTYTNIIKAFYFQRTPNLVLYILFMSVCAYGAKKGLQHIGSVAYLVIFYAAGSFLLAQVLSVPESDFNSLFPIWGTGMEDLIKVSPMRISLFTDFFLLTTAIPFMKSKKEYQRGTWIAFSIVVIQLSTAFVFFLCLFDTLKGIGYPFHSLTRYISLGGFLTNIETFFFPIWMMGAFIRFTALLYINALLFGQLCKVKDFEYLIPSLAAIYLLMGLIPESAIEVSLIKGTMQKINSSVFALIMILLWLAALLKGEFKHAKNKNSM